MRSHRRANPRAVELEDLADLCDGPGLTLYLGRESARLRLGTRKEPLYEQWSDGWWWWLNRRERAEVILKWIRDAIWIIEGRLLPGEVPLKASFPDDLELVWEVLPVHPEEPEEKKQPEGGGA